MFSTVYPTDAVDHFDELVRFLEADQHPSVIQTSSGHQMQLPSEVVDVIIQSAELMARGKAVVVTSQARSRFI